MVGMSLVLASFLLVYPIRGEVVDLSTQEGGEYDELVELNLPVALSTQSAEFRAFMISVQLQELINYIHTLTSSPNFPYISTEDLQKLADLAGKLALVDDLIILEEVPDYDLSE